VHLAAFASDAWAGAVRADASGPALSLDVPTVLASWSSGLGLGGCRNASASRNGGARLGRTQLPGWTFLVGLSVSVLLLRAYMRDFFLHLQYRLLRCSSTGHQWPFVSFVLPARCGLVWSLPPCPRFRAGTAAGTMSSRASQGATNIHTHTHLYMVAATRRPTGLLPFGREGNVFCCEALPFLVIHK